MRMVLIWPTEDGDPLGLSIDVSTFRRMSPYPPEAHLKELKCRGRIEGDGDGSDGNKDGGGNGSNGGNEGTRDSSEGERVGGKGAEDGAKVLELKMAAKVLEAILMARTKERAKLQEHGLEMELEPVLVGSQRQASA